MPFLSLTFDIDASDADAWSDALLEAGAMSVDASDPRAGTAEEAPLYGEPGEAGAELWPVVRLAALFGEGIDARAALAQAAGSLAGQLPAFELRALGDCDWVHATRLQFSPIRIAPRFWIVPSWCEPPEPDAVNLRLDPGLAFGTGSHPTTRLCLEWLAAELRRGQSVLDYGCGSGVLAIAAAKLGASVVVGTDIDPQALAASGANARQNGVHATFVAPDALGAGRFEVVVANILANPLVVLAPAIAGRVRERGRLALCGILETQAAAVAAAYARWFIIAAARSADGWVLLTGDRRADAPA